MKSFGLPLAVAKIRAAMRLGLASVARVGAYRALLKTGYYRSSLPVLPAVRGPFFQWHDRTPGACLPQGVDGAPWIRDGHRVLRGEIPVFSNAWAQTGFPPRWHQSVVTQVDIDSPSRHWTQFPDFGLPGGDIKGYWEPARFKGLVIMALGWLACGEEELRVGIEKWLKDWSHKNPANAGVQWKCGQETGIRLMNLLVAANLLEHGAGARPLPGFKQLVKQHCDRIESTMMYAIGQDNNHGTSEAAALFAAGVFLAHSTPVAEIGKAQRWRDMGREWIEEQVMRLVMDDGSFSQHSINYHRMMLDTVCFAETWRRRFGEPPFSPAFHARCVAATKWLADMTDPASGDAPNIGANDGAHLFALHRLPYRDYRPTVQWASVLFRNSRAYPHGLWDEQLLWMNVASHDGAEPPDHASASRLMADGGYVKLAGNGTRAILRLPQYRFRPSHSDALHLELWVGSENVLRDGGSFSYGAGENWLNYFSGVASHNTVQFDGRDQMPRLSRFLFGDWLKCTELVFDAAVPSMSAAYRDYRGATHRRTVRAMGNQYIVTDQIAGFHASAVLRWRCISGSWSLVGSTLTGMHAKLSVEATMPIHRLELVEGWESRHYAEKTPIPVLEVEVHTPGTLTTRIEVSSS